MVASTTVDGSAGMVVGSFTSVPLEPPLVAFFPPSRRRSGQRSRWLEPFA
ncbi:flavin reductase [Sphingobium sp. SCG-1]|nr:flavin reductase [Sphingobium sp. SCG-1]